MWSVVFFSLTDITGTTPSTEIRAFVRRDEPKVKEQRHFVKWKGPFHCCEPADIMPLSMVHDELFSNWLPLPFFLFRGKLIIPLVIEEATPRVLYEASKQHPHYDLQT